MAIGEERERLDRRRVSGTAAALVRLVTEKKKAVPWFYTMLFYHVSFCVFPCSFRAGSRMQKKKLDKIYTNTNYKEALN
jgi:hypothetical protein